jgi:hypothetical protein
VDQRVEEKQSDEPSFEPRLRTAFEAGALQVKIDAVRFKTELIVTRNGKLTRIPPGDLIPDLEAAGLEVIIVRPKRKD